MASCVQIERTQTLGCRGWLDEQFDMPSGTRWIGWWPMAADISHKTTRRDSMPPPEQTAEFPIRCASA
jgi:hypothetical protein